VVAAVVKGGKRKGILGAGGAAVSVAGGFGGAWVTLPVTNTPGCVTLAARPRAFTDLFEVRISEARCEEIGGALGPVRCIGAGSSRPPLGSMFDEKIVVVSATPMHPVVGLQRMTIEYWNAKTEVWVFNLGGRTIAIK
jgi:hypothetical protein